MWITILRYNTKTSLLRTTEYHSETMTGRRAGRQGRQGRMAGRRADRADRAGWQAGGQTGQTGQTGQAGGVTTGQQDSGETARRSGGAEERLRQRRQKKTRYQQTTRAVTKIQLVISLTDPRDQIFPRHNR